MKSYHHLWEAFISEENIKFAILNSSKGKRDRRDVKEYYENLDVFIPAIRRYAEEFKNRPHKAKEINDGISQKKRLIMVPWYEEQVIHHMLVQILEPIFMKGMYEHSYGSIPGRGAHNAKKVIESWIRHDKKNTKYYLKMDVRKYFNTVPHDILKKKLSKIIHDEKFLKVLFKVIDVTDVGIPIGFYTSQWLANWYLTGLDHYIKEELKAVHYVRYMDDMVIFGSNKKKLHKMRTEIKKYLNNKLGLEMKDNWTVERFSYKTKDGEERGRDLDFMGFRFFRDRTILRRSVLLKATRKARRIYKKGKTPSVYECRQMLSYMGWFGCTNTYNVFQQRVRPYVNIRKMKALVSRYDRTRSKIGLANQQI